MQIQEPYPKTISQTRILVLLM